MGTLCALGGDGSAALETSALKDLLLAMNQKRMFTINSQPAVNGVPSSDKVYGWGPRDGYIYQKAYLEFFVPPELFEKLRAKVLSSPMMTYFAVNSKVPYRQHARRPGWAGAPGAPRSHDQRTRVRRAQTLTRTRGPGHAHDECQDRAHQRRHVGRLPRKRDPPAHRGGRAGVYGVEGALLWVAGRAGREGSVAGLTRRLWRAPCAPRRTGRGV